MAPRTPRTPGREAILKQSGRAPLHDFETKLTQLLAPLFAEYQDLGVLPAPDKLGKLACEVVTELATEAKAKATKA